MILTSNAWMEQRLELDIEECPPHSYPAKYGIVAANRGLLDTMAHIAE